jgi:hypothetical protein
MDTLGQKAPPIQHILMFNCIHWVLYMVENTQLKNVSMRPLGTSLIGAQWRLLGSVQWKLPSERFHCTQRMACNGCFWFTCPLEPSLVQAV